jgi:hypothetical protein
VLALAITAVVGVAGLLLAAGTDGRWTAFSLDIPPADPVAALHQGKTICQGPFTATAAFGSITPWIMPVAPTSAAQTGPTGGPPIALTVQDATTNEILASGEIAAGYAGPISPSVALSRTVPSGQRVRVCLRSRGPGVSVLLGAPPPNPVVAAEDGAASGAGKAAIALLFRRPHPRSLLSMVPTIFGRASLFRPSWVGPWTYWLLSAALLGTFVLAGVALTRAARSDEARWPPQGDPVE